MTKKKVSSNFDKLRELGVLDKWHTKTFDQFTSDPSALLKVKNYIKNRENVMQQGTGLFIYGAWGVGKTHLMNCAIKELLDYGYTCRIITLATLITKFTAAWYDNDERREFLKLIQQVHFLGIDDLGKEFKGSSELGLRVFDNIVRFRLQANLPIIFTANLKPSELKEYYSEGVASMLQEMCAMIKVEGDDHRKSFTEKNSRILS